MFKKKKKIVNEVFGEVKYLRNNWITSAKIQIVLWNKAYELNIGIVENQEKSGINKLQEETYIKFKENLAENQNKVEEIVSKFFNTTNVDSLISKFIPYHLQINTNGECALIAENTDDEELLGLAIIIYPKMAFFTDEDYYEYVFLSGDEEIKKELYGGD